MNRQKRLVGYKYIGLNGHSLALFKKNIIKKRLNSLSNGYNYIYNGIVHNSLYIYRNHHQNNKTGRDSIGPAVIGR